MKKENKRDIYEVYEMLCARDPDWRHPKIRTKFETLFLGWRAVELRHKCHSTTFYTDSIRRGWLPKADFERFKQYAMQ